MSAFHEAFNQTFGNMLRLTDMQQRRAVESRRLDQAERATLADEKHRADDLTLRREQLESNEKYRADNLTFHHEQLKSNEKHQTDDLALRREQLEGTERVRQDERERSQRGERARVMKQGYTEVQSLLDSGRTAEAAAKAKGYGITAQLDDLVAVGEASRVMGDAFAAGDPRALSSPEVQKAQTRIGEALLRASGRGGEYRDPQFTGTDEFLQGLPDGPRRQALQQAVEQKFGRAGGVIMTFADANGARFTATEAQSSDPDDPIRVQSWDDIHGALQTWATSGEHARALRDQLAAGLAGAKAYLGETERRVNPSAGSGITPDTDDPQRDDGSAYMAGLGITPDTDDPRRDADARHIVSTSTASIAAPQLRAAVLGKQSEADWALAARKGKLPNGKKITTPDGVAWKDLEPYQRRQIGTEAYQLYAAEATLDRMFRPAIEEALKGTDLTFRAVKTWVLKQAQDGGDGDISAAVSALLDDPESVVRRVKKEKVDAQLKPLLEVEFRL